MAKMYNLVSKIKNPAGEIIRNLEFNSILNCWVIDQGSFKRVCRLVSVNSSEFQLYCFIGENKDSFGLFGISIDVHAGFITYNGCRVTINFYE